MTDPVARNSEIVDESPRSLVQEKVKNWRPKTQSGRLTRAGRFPNYMTVRKSKFGVHEPEITFRKRTQDCTSEGGPHW